MTDRQPMDGITALLERALATPGRITALTGAGISAESGIPTFRGPEGYWTVGSKVYHPQEMATHAMFKKNPRAVWQWYLYRLGICRNAAPNAGHKALVDLEQVLGDRFVLITQNVDNLHLRAGHRPESTYQIHGNVGFARCADDCRQQILPMPAAVAAKARDEAITEDEWARLHCSACGGVLRPHVLWFDETYNERYYRLRSTLAAAADTALLIVVGTSGATNLPSQVFAEVYRRGGVILDINIESNPFGDAADAHPYGKSIRQRSSRALPRLAAEIARIVQQSSQDRR